MSIEPVVQYSSSCKTRSVSNINTLKVHVPIKSLALEVLVRACENDVVTRQYGEVKVYWGGSLGEQIEFLAKGIADVILTKDNIMSALMAESTHSYKPVIGYPAYSAFFISNTEKPTLSKSYFLDKKIGLLDYPTSRSGHILPKSALKDLDIDINALDITYLSSHQALRERLASGEVDIIASYWSDEDEVRFSKNYITPIADNVSGSKWYLKMNNNNTDLVCALQGVVHQIAQSRTSSYFDKVDTYWQCEKAPYRFIGEKNGAK
ncbi:PhnD/SsuA/transferrin family substrate-binding protein [Pseudoalteromonas sp. McH1-7]|nr:PhnD/SsuA/transferrin family substrate-binding protein [Pseudoalteromonas sp. McH1-7]